MQPETPEWFDICKLMQDMGRTLPEDWDHTPDFWMGAVQQLAELTVVLRGKMPVEQIGALIGAGGMMIAQAEKQVDATNLTNALFSQIKGGARD